MTGLPDRFGTGSSSSVPEVTSRALLVVLAGRPGTGKTTLARLLAHKLQAAYLRIDAIETVVLRYGLQKPPLGPIGYGIAHEIAAATLQVGTPVVIDAANPVPEARAGWHPLTQHARLVVIETVIADPLEHRRRVSARRPDLIGQVVPTWEQVQDGDYLPWDEQRDGPRHVVDMTDTEQGAATAIRLLSPPKPDQR